MNLPDSHNVVVEQLVGESKEKILMICGCAPKKSHLSVFEEGPREEPQASQLASTMFFTHFLKDNL